MKPLLLILSWPLLAFAPTPTRHLYHIPTIPELIIQEASRQGVPPHLALGTAWRESKFNPSARHKNKNHTEDRGVFQLNSRYYSGTTVEENIRLGVAAVAKAARCRQMTWAYTHGHCGGGK